MDKKQPPATSSMNTRIPTQITEALRELAKQHDRSLNGEIVRALREYVERHQDEHKMSTR